MAQRGGIYRGSRRQRGGIYRGSETGAQTPNVLKFENKHFSIFD